MSRAQLLRAAERTSWRYLPRTSFRKSSNFATSDCSVATQSRPTWQIRMLFDGDCPLCMKEVNFLKSRDNGRGRIDFVDISSPTYNPADNAGITFEQAMEHIHAIEANGNVITNIEVFRKLYEAVGLGWVYAITAIPAVERAANAVYGFWAKYRMNITGREALSVILTRRRQAATAQGAIVGSHCADADAACEIPSRRGLYTATPAKESTSPPPSFSPPSLEARHSPIAAAPPGCGEEDVACEIPLKR